MAQPAFTLWRIARYSQMSFHRGVQGLFRQIPLGEVPLGETFSRDPEHCQPAIICGSGVSEGYLPEKTGQGKAGIMVEPVIYSTRTSVGAAGAI